VDITGAAMGGVFAFVLAFREPDFEEEYAWPGDM
jgi:esterase/lipase